MYNKIFLVLALISTTMCGLFGQTQFGYLSYTTTNIGDDIQSIAARQFLPKDSIPINRDRVAHFSHDKPVPTLMNGWFMGITSKTIWPPSKSINPLILSMYIAPARYKHLFTDEGIQYFKDHAPVGARDFTTLKAFQERDIPCYFSGCLTLTLPYVEKERDDVIYIVDVYDKECVQYIKEHATCRVETVHHGVPQKMLTNHEKRTAYAESILEKYRRAKCVITHRLHAALPCLAFQTPVLLLCGDNPANHFRFNGLHTLLRTCSYEVFKEGFSGFDFNDPEPNSDDYLVLRKELINTVTNWVNQEATAASLPYSKSGDLD